MVTVSGAARLDAGRLIMVPAAAGMLAISLPALVRGAAAGPAGVAGLLRSFTTALICVFYLLTGWAYLRRGPAVATSRSVTAHLAAVAATLAVYAFPLLAGPPAGPARQGAAGLLLVAGNGWAVWSVRSLGRSLSVIAQARVVVDRGPYRFVRHPLYLGELVSSVGLAVAGGTLPAAGLWLALCGLQAYRALREEQVLLRALPGYRSYRNRTAALIPGLW